MHHLKTKKTTTPWSPGLAMAAALSFGLAACGGPGEPDPDPAQDGPGEVLMSSLERELNPQVDAEDSARLAGDNRDFAFGLLRQLDEEHSDENLFFSPHSISIALAMTYAGASGETYEQMADVLRFTLEEEVLHRAFNSLDLELGRRGDVEIDPEEGGDPPELRIVNATWGQEGYPFSSDFLDVLASNYGAGLRIMDFVTDPNGSREEINAWVEDQTEERIKDLLPEDSIQPSTVLVLTNAIYFLAGWSDPFREASTNELPFTRPDGSTVTAELMRKYDAEEFSYYLGDETLAISMPYVGKEISLVAWMPAEGDDFADWETDLSRESFDAVVDALQPGVGHVLFPKFTFGGEYDLMALFEDMGWTNFMSLTRMAEGPSALEITGIFHKSFIALDEEGTEAAAATAVVVGESAAPEPNFDLAFDRPFYYAIYDHPTDTILFLGRVYDPTAEE